MLAAAGKAYYFQARLTAVAVCPKCGGEGRLVGENKYLCGQCGTEFYVCPLCGAAFFSPQQLGGHMKYHRREQERGQDPVLATLQEIASTLQEIVGRLDRQEERLARLERILASLQAPQQAPAQEGAEDLPEFVRGNPWLKILSR